MNNIKNLVGLIEELGGKAELDIICRKYQEKNKDSLTEIEIGVITKTLRDNPEIVYFDSASNCWELKNNSSNKTCNFLYISDNRHFRKAREAMLELFGKRVNSGNLYFQNVVGNNIDVWFAKGTNGWNNVISSDGTTIVEQNSELSDEVKLQRQKLDTNLRATFLYDKNGYYFVGVFKHTSFDKEGSHTYKLVDNKVEIIEKENNKHVLVCNIGYMKYYNGLTNADNKITGGGSYTELNNQGGEIYNFKKCEDGYTYGFVETNYKGGKINTGKIEYAKNINIDKIGSIDEGQKYIDGVRVIFISKGNNQSSNVIVGWYENATVYRSRQKGNTTFGYNIKCLNNDAHLIPENDRYFEYPKKNLDGTYNFGQEQVSYPYLDKKQKSTIALIDNANHYIDVLLSNERIPGFVSYLDAKVLSKELTDESRKQYINSINQISSQLIGKHINKPIYEIDDIDSVRKLYDDLLDNTNELYAVNKKRKYTWSAAVSQYIEYIKLQKVDSVNTKDKL